MTSLRLAALSLIAAAVFAVTIVYGILRWYG